MAFQGANMPKTESPDVTGGVEDREKDRQEVELDDQQNLKQGMDTGTHSSARSGVNWGRSYRGKLVPDEKMEREDSTIGSEVLMSPNLSMRDEIARRAYALYLTRGCEHGRDMEDWFQATKELTGPVSESKETEAAKELVSARADLRSAWPE
jgi:hypothetical protein